MVDFLIVYYSHTFTHSYNLVPFLPAGISLHSHAPEQAKINIGSADKSSKDQLKRIKYRTDIKNSK
jgi:hypothetical protein